MTKTLIFLCFLQYIDYWNIKTKKNLPESPFQSCQRQWVWDKAQIKGRAKGEGKCTGGESRACRNALVNGSKMMSYSQQCWDPPHGSFWPTVMLWFTSFVIIKDNRPSFIFFFLYLPWEKPPTVHPSSPMLLFLHKHFNNCSILTIYLTYSNRRCRCWYLQINFQQINLTSYVSFLPSLWCFT